MDVLVFKVVGSACSESRNTQDDDFVCADNGQPSNPVEGTSVQVYCSNGSNAQVIVNETTTVGEVIKMKNRSDGLPATLSCAVKDENGGDLQTIDLNTGGDTDLFLKDRFGMLQLESCTVETLPEQVCAIPVQYTYTVSNLGEVPMEMTNFGRTRNRDTTHILDQLPIQEINPGNSTFVVENDSIDMCIAGVHETVMLAEADTLQGEPCFSLKQYLFGIVDSCRVDIGISCESDDGIECQDLEQRVEDCTVGITYTIDLHNVGTGDLSIGYLGIIYNGTQINNPDSILNDLSPGRKTSVKHTDIIDLCVSGQYDVSATVGALPSSDGHCVRSERYPFEIIATAPPTFSPSSEPSSSPSQSGIPSDTPSTFPSSTPSSLPSTKPSATPSSDPSTRPSMVPSSSPSIVPSSVPSGLPSLSPSKSLSPSTNPSESIQPSSIPTVSQAPSTMPSHQPSTGPSFAPSEQPSSSPSKLPSEAPSFVPSKQPSAVPSLSPSKQPSSAPTSSARPSIVPSESAYPSILPSLSYNPSSVPTVSQAPSVTPSNQPSTVPSFLPSKQPSHSPSSEPSNLPSQAPSNQPSTVPSISPSNHPSGSPTTSAAPSKEPSGSPSSSPSVAPSSEPSSQPSPDPLLAGCDLGASIGCHQLEGGSCDELSSPANKTCLGSKAEELSFIYIPSSLCNGTNSQDSFTCTDFNTGTARPFTAFIRVLMDLDIFYEGAVTSGELFRVPIPPTDNEVRVAIFTVAASGGPAAILQTSLISVQCRQEDGLTLLDTFGNVQLTGFKNAEMGSQQVFADIEITYTTTNELIFDANLLTALIDSPFSGYYEAFPTGSKRQIGSGDNETFTESFFLNLASSSGSSFDFNFEIQGEGDLSGIVCKDEVSYSLNVQ
jgi:hypothetical protein